MCMASVLLSLNSKEGAYASTMDIFPKIVAIFTVKSLLIISEDVQNPTSRKYFSVPSSNISYQMTNRLEVSLFVNRLTSCSTPPFLLLLLLLSLVDIVYSLVPLFLLDMAFFFEILPLRHAYRERIDSDYS